MPTSISILSASYAWDGPMLRPLSQDQAALTESAFPSPWFAPGSPCSAASLPVLPYLSLSSRDRESRRIDECPSTVDCQQLRHKQDHVVGKLLYRITTGVSALVNIRSVALSIHDDGLLHQRQREPEIDRNLLLVLSVLHSVRVKDNLGSQDTPCVDGSTWQSQCLCMFICFCGLPLYAALVLKELVTSVED
ncbi:hypothetical protein IRJ41_013123 [Triplophysa rosa]|uniref:Uncharacterized protein n=1 Tax=Triplophysa rosa TaxID=992332 RepID=A0A9W8CAU6_TRIRA|nr:hypothetical protein IRJ41_013123 [Triplophysa rosa]